MPVYGDGRQIRDWLHVEDHCAGIEHVLREGAPGEAYNVGGGNERENIEITRLIVELTGADPSLVRHVADRPGTTGATRWTPPSPGSAGRRSARSRRASRNRRVVPRQPRLVGADQVRRVPDYYRRQYAERLA